MILDLLSFMLLIGLPVALLVWAIGWAIADTLEDIRWNREHDA